MAIVPERNDVDISRLFNWSGSLELVDKYEKPLMQNGKPVTIYLRLCGDEQVNRARVYAIRKSAELRHKLKTEDSDERVAFISTIFDMEDKEELVNATCFLKIREFNEQAMKEVKVPFPKEVKSDAPLEEYERFQKEVDAYPTKRQEAISDYIYSALQKHQAFLLGKEEEYIRKEFEKAMIGKLCEEEMVIKFKDYCVFLGSFADPEFRVPFFSTIEEFMNLPTEIKEQISDKYSSLELNVDDLKKLLEATP